MTPPAQRAGSLIRARLRQLGGRRLVDLRRSRQAPELSVVMPVHNVAAYLPAALDSALAQTFGNLELIAVDDGSTDECLSILRDYERRDFRVRVLTQANAGQGVARNVGVDHARGEFLTFLDSDDTLPADAYRSMLEGLRSSGSDFCVGNLRRLRHGELHRMIWSRTVHRQDRIGTTITEFPSAMQDIIACNRMFRTAFWREQVGAFRGAIAYEDHVPMLMAYVRAARFDVLQQVTYHWRIREDLTSTGQQKARIQNLRDRITVMEEAHALLEAEATEPVRDAWVGRVLEVDLTPFLPFALAGDDAYRALLAATYQTFLERASQQALGQVRVAMRVRAHLAAQERWEDLFAADDWLREVQNMPPTTVEGDRLVADFPPDCTWADALPADQRWMSPLECHFEGAVEHLEWGRTSLRITGWAVLRGMEMAGAAGGTTIRVWLVAATDPATQVELAVEQLDLAEADAWGPLANASYAGGGFVATVDVATLTSHSSRADSWFLRAKVEQERLSAVGELHGRVARSAAARDSEATVGGRVLSAGWSPATGLSLRVHPDRARAERPATDSSAEPIAGPPARRAGRRLQVEDVALSSGRLVVSVSGLAEEDGSPVLVAESSVPVVERSRAGDLTRLAFALTVVDLDGREQPAPSGSYRLRRFDAQGGRRFAEAGAAFAGRAPHRLRDQNHGIQAGQRPDGQAVFVLGPPLRADEVGAVNRHRHQQRYRAASINPTDSVLLSSAGGRLATGDQLAMDRWLAEHRPDLARLWSVADRSVPVPDGAVGLLHDSREWYDAVASARFLSSDTDLGRFFRRREHQRHLRTWAGHPYEPTGVGALRREGMIEHLINRELAHLHAEWDCVLAPDPETEPVLREQFRWAGEVLVAGSPRTDAIVNADRAAVRRRVLRRLELDDEVTLVLHAPAPRDAIDLARPGGHAALDLRELARALGPTHRVLHRTDTADRRPRPDLSGVLDVSGYPDLTDLVVAADAAVLDHSSLRFDWALTGRPALFFVPDLAAWTASRSTLFAWEETAPGPWLRTTADVIEQLSDLAGTGAAYADAVSAFNRRFNALNDGHATDRVLRHLLR